MATSDLQLTNGRRAWKTALILASLLSLPALRGGFCADDTSIVLRLEGHLPGSHHPLDLYRFIDGSTQGVQRLVERGGFPWFADPHLKLAFFRPLAGALWWAEHAVFGRSAVFYHGLSVLWYLGLLYVAWLLFRRTLPVGLAGLAAILFAASDTHAMAVAWLSNRHAVIAAGLTLGGLVLHLRAREDGFRPGWGLSALCYALGLCAGETALGALAYLYSYELLGRSDALSGRIKALLPSSLLVLGYLILYKRLGYGAAGSAGYLDPLAEPAAFLRAAPERILVLFGSLLGGAPADVASARPELVPPAMAVGLGLVLLASLLLFAVWRTLAAAQRQTFRWLLAGAALSLIPSLGGYPGTRLLLPASFGGVALLALLLHHAHGRARTGPLPRKLLFALLVVLYGLRPPVLFTFLVAKMNQLGGLGARLAQTAELPAAPETAVVVLAAADPLVGMFSSSMLQLQTGRQWRAWWTLSLTERDHAVSRLAPDTLELAVQEGRMLESATEKLVRKPSRRFAVGDTVTLLGAEVRVLAEQEGRPTRIAVKFDRPLDDAALWFVAWRDGALRRVSIPGPGVVLHLPHTPGPTAD